MMTTVLCIRDHLLREGQPALAEAVKQMGEEWLSYRVALHAVCELDTRTDYLSEAQEIAEGALYPGDKVVEL